MHFVQKIVVLHMEIKLKIHQTVNCLESLLMV